MKRAILFAAALSMAAMSGAVERKSTAGMADVAEALAAAQRGDCPRALEAIARVKTSQAFRERADLRSGLLQMSVACLSELKKPKEAYAEALIATGDPDSDGYVWQIRLWYEVDQKDWPAVVTTIEGLRNGHGAVLNALPVSALYSIDNIMRTAGQSF